MQRTSAPPDIVRDESHSFGVIASIQRSAGKFWSEALIIIIAVSLWLPRFSGPIDLRYDASVYYLLGTSLAAGHGYRIESEPDRRRRCNIRRSASGHYSCVSKSARHK